MNGSGKRQMVTRKNAPKGRANKILAMLVGESPGLSAAYGGSPRKRS